MRIRDEYFIVRKIGPIANIYLIPDCHIGSPAFLKEQFERLAEIIENDPLALIIFQGDILDANRPTTRKAKEILYHDRKEEYTQEDDRNDTWLEHKVIPMLKRLIGNKDRCLGMMDGDHYMMMENGISSTQHMATILGVPYLGDGQAILKLHFAYGKKNGKKDCPRTKVVIHVQHGIGGGGRAGTGVNRLEDTANAWDGVDIFMRGHSHKGFVFPVSKYYVPHMGSEIRQRDIWLVNTPSFRTGYVVGKTDYAEHRNYGATAHKFPVIKLWCDKSRLNHQSFRVNISAEMV